MKFTSADLLSAMGLKVGDRIKTEHNSELEVIYDAVHCVYLLAEPQKKDEFRSVRSVESLTNVEFEMFEPKRKLSDAERVILENLPKDCGGWITRDRDNILIASEFKPIKYEKGKWHFENRNFEILPFEHLFQFITRGDEPYEIKELLK